VEAAKALMRYFSYLFHGLLALALIAISALALATDPQSLQLGMLPWQGPTLVYVLLVGAIFGLVTVLLAIKSTWRVLFLLWSAAVSILLINGYIFSHYRFHPGEPSRAFFLTIASLIALAGAWFQFRRSPSLAPSN